MTPIRGADDVCAAVTATLEAFLPWALGVVHAGGGLELAEPTAAEMPTEEALLAGGGLTTPCYVVSTPGLAGPPSRSGSGEYSATWRVIVTFFCHGGSYDDTATRARQYAKAGRAALVLNAQLGGLASDVQWVGEEYDRIAGRAARTLAGAFVSFDVAVDGVLDEDLTGVPVTAIDLTTRLLPVLGEDQP